MAAPAAALGELTVLDRVGGEVPLRSLWKEQTAVLAFVRHFGWIFCKQQVAQLRGIKDQIVEAGAKLVVVGNGLPEQAVWFAEDTGFDGEIYTDPSLETYRLLGMKSGMLITLNPVVMMRGMRARSEGFRQTKTMGHPFQQGGVIIVRPDGSIPYRYISDSAGDHPDPQDILAALTSN